MPIPSDPAEYKCPICNTSLLLNTKSLQCENGHSFDYAKEGYVHLLPVQLKKSLNPGDDKNMVVARREFLQQGYYDFLRQTLLTEIQISTNEKLLDLGCGEGFYTNFIADALPDTTTYGVDISKEAVKYAAKRSSKVHYSVATNAHTPFSEQQFDVIINIFAPLVGKECQRILKHNGRILSVAPSKHHLIELKQCIYDNPELHSPATPPDGFVLKQSTNVLKEIEINNPTDLENLLTMTPFGWKITPEKKRALLSNLPFILTLDFDLNEFVIDPN
ncbi:MAG: methyltransferase domain-containing protein [Gammaproteobacteria bacterium]|nr:methyltransferase domain-containing protein [Gammaproteobacteria bacterium]